MDVLHALPRVTAGVDYGSIAVRQPMTARDLGRNPMQMSDQCGVGFAGIRNRGDMLTRNDQHMHRRFWIDVCERIGLLVLIDGLGWNASFNNPAKQAAHDYAV